MSSSRVDLPTQLYTSDILLYLLFANIFMARQFESESKGWHQNFPKHIGRLEATFQTCDKIKTDEDECIYYPLVYGQEEKLKIIANPQGRYGPYKKTNSQSPLKKTYMKENKTISYGTEDDGCYALLRGNATQADIQSAPRHQFGSRAGQELPAPVPRSVLRSLSYDLQQNKNHDHRVMTLEPCRQHMQVSLNNNYEQHVKKASGHSPHDGLNGDNSEELLDYCTCMCCVKGVFYHFTKDCEDEGHMADQPCSCDGPLSLCVPRWGCLGIFSLFLPCLCCYLPAKGCLKLQQCSLKNNQEWK